MNLEQKKTLAERLAQLDSNERLKLYKRASALRKHRRPKGSGRDRTRDDEAVSVKMRKESLDDFILELLLQDEIAPPLVSTKTAFGQVVWVGPKTCRVRSPPREVACDLRGLSVAVGDFVEWCEIEGSDPQLVSVRPRQTRLSRPDVDNANKERVIAANIDAIVVVVSVKTPPLHPRLIDRYLIAIQRGGAEAVICVNKLDLLDEAERDEELSKLLPYVEIDVPIVSCSTQSGEGLEGLREILRGKTCAFVGHSGVGKSSILNAMAPNLGLLTGEVSQGYGRGTHTTTASTLYELSDGTKVIDTPGIRSFGLWKMSASELSFYFEEFQDLACRFSDCTHLHEPGCGVKQAVAEGKLHPARYETYKRLADSLS